ncbi:DUF6090 family protein [Saccharicrinis sp. FJH54]|uniref:DUF6090 family protein n=1 Tax=Saccharicrinis sp. FJH54 TaxID=3344665 RepID=UPI0035D48FA2
MITIFRNIRKKLAAEQKITAYLRYAIGEILLVVIGILIALQVNNWKEDIKNIELERNTLENIRSDLVLQQEVINEQLHFEKLMIAKTDTASLYLSSSLPLEKLNSLLEKLSERRTFIANKTSYTGMNKNGDKKLFRNSGLQNAIARYYQQLDYMTQVINNNNLFIIDRQFGTFFSSNSLNIKLTEDGKIDNKQKLTTEKRLQLKNQLQVRKTVSENIYRLCHEQQETTQYVIQLIDNELH